MLLSVFMKTHEHGRKDLKQNTTDSAHSTHFELHTWHPYENSHKCHAAEGAVAVKVFTTRSLSDTTRIDMFKGYHGTNSHTYQITVHARITSLL
jgi:hypothetical protein